MMSENLTALASENLNPSLRSLLEDVQRGYIRVPRFQRPFVWSSTQRLELLRSIRDNMPIGSLLVWRTSRFRLASFPEVGPHPIPPIAPDAPATGWQYLLDGHQRVTTLLGLLLQPAPGSPERSPDDDGPDWDIQYDLMDADFVFARKRTRLRAAARPLLPLWTLFDGRLVMKHMRELRKQGERWRWTEADLDTWEARADQLSYRFQQCRIPIVVMVTDDLGLAARTFQRINSLGTPMGEAHLVAALTWREDFDLRDQIDQLRKTLPAGWRDVDEDLVLQICKGLAGLDMTKAGQTELVKKIEADPTLLERAGAGLERAVHLVSNDASVVHQDLLPYAFQLTLLAVESDPAKGRVLPRDAVLSWFWRTSWSEAFASATYRQVRTEHERLRRAADGTPEALWTRDEPLPDRFDYRSARVRLVTLRLATRAGLVDADGQPADGRSLLVAHGREALVRLFPAPRGAAPALKRLLQGAGNRFLLDPGTDAKLRDRLQTGPDLDDQALTSHFVDTEALRALRTGDLATFVRRRAEALEAWDLSEWQHERQAAGGSSDSDAEVE